MRLSVIGLGKLGSCTAACFAAKGFETVGVDLNRSLVDAIQSGKAPVVEPRLQEFISLADNKLTATLDFGDALKNSEITFLIVPTPSKPDGHFSDRFLQDALTRLAEEYKNIEKEYHVFVIVSTVSPGTTEKNLIPLIESVSGKKYIKDFGVCYNPEFIALGSVINDFLNPDVTLIGESDKKAGDMVEAVYERVCENNHHVARMSITSAEITKISLNSYVTTKISFANTLANICEQMPGANIDDITEALGADTRISPYYLKGGLSYGGPCFPRDNRAFSAFAKECGVDALLANATDKVNHHQVLRLVEKVLDFVSRSKTKTVSILGLSYKPHTPIIEESPAIKIIEELIGKEDIEVMVYDPLAIENTMAHFGDNILYASTLEDCLAHSDLCVITTPDNEFKKIGEDQLVHNKTTVIDCWRILESLEGSKKVDYIPLGKKIVS